MNERWSLSYKDTATVERRRWQMTTFQTAATSRLVDTKQQSGDDETSNKIREADVKQVETTNGDNRRQRVVEIIQELSEN